MKIDNNDLKECKLLIKEGHIPFMLLKIITKICS